MVTPTNHHVSSVTNQVAWLRHGVPRDRTTSDDYDPPIVMGDGEPAEFKRRRNLLKLSTRALAALAKTTHATITNLENGNQTTAKRSLYIALVRVLFRDSPITAEDRADQSIARNDAAVRRLSRALAGRSTEQIEALAAGVEAMSGKPQ